MIFKEKLTWILDPKNKKFSDEEYQINIDFVHSLGKKCDSVGWSVLNFDEPDADKILEEIDSFCKKNKWRARGYYERYFTDIVSDWYELKTTDFKDSSVADFVNVNDENGKELSLAVIKAYNELSHSPKECNGICVPERFRNSCIKNNITNVDFCWIQDKGKFESEQYFYIYPDQKIPQIICDIDLKKDDTLKLMSLGGYLPKIASIFYELQHIELPDCYLSEDMPDGGIAYVFCPSTDSYAGRHKILIHKDTAKILIKDKALSLSNLLPVLITDKCPDGYTLDKTQIQPKPSKKHIAQSLIQYEKIKAANRPEYNVSEKDALKLLRKAKSERKEDFNKKLSKSALEATQAEYAPLLPYYNVANGGQLSDEYRLLSYDESTVSGKEFFAQAEKEELSDIKPEGIVFSVCADGDVVLLTETQEVIRYSHEVPEAIDSWTNLAQFFAHAINDN